MKKGVQITFNLSNRWLYSLIALTFILIVGVGVYAFGTSSPSTFGHSPGEIEGVCLSDGTNCLPETDPQVGSITNNKWCIGSSGVVVCNQDAPSFTETDPIFIASWANSDNPSIPGNLIVESNVWDGVETEIYFSSGGDRTASPVKCPIGTYIIGIKALTSAKCFGSTSSHYACARGTFICSGL